MPSPDTIFIVAASERQQTLVWHQQRPSTLSATA